MPATTAVRDHPSALDFLLGRVNYERTTSVPYRSSEFKLDRMWRLMGLLGDPQLALKVVHIAGTKGKGSTAAMIAAVLQAEGYRTGLYTSPHLERIEERIVIDGRLCPAAEFASLAADVQPAVEKLDRESTAAGASGPTFFEVTTAMAFLHFARAKVDVAVLEVGLGGRLDSTNVCRPEVCLITSISFDHVRQLGRTLAAIAGEKAGIIKPGIPIVSGVLIEEPRQVIAARAAVAGAPLVQRGVDFDFSQPAVGIVPVNSPGCLGSSEASPRPAGVELRRAPATLWAGNGHAAAGAYESFDYHEPAKRPLIELTDVRLRMLGAHQAANAAAAIAAMHCLRDRDWRISDDAIRRGLAAARCPARIEPVGTRPMVILDVAHNLASVGAFLAVLRQRFAARHSVLIFASSMDKDYAGMLRLLVPRFDAVILTRYVDNPRAMDVAELVRIAASLASNHSRVRARQQVQAAADPATALALARQWAGPDDLICITGSFFLAAELRPLLVEDKVERVSSSSS